MVEKAQPGPSTLTALRPEDVHAYVARTCFKTGPPGRIGVELEWLVVDLTAPAAPVPLSRVRAAVDAAPALPHGSRLTYEPGGQLELSSLPAPDLTSSWRSVTADVAALRAAVHADGLHLLGAGIDPLRAPHRQVHSPRYDAMAHYFDVRGPASRDAGPWMMCSTAAVQVCVDAGADADDIARRWSLANALGPVLIATFANSAQRCAARSDQQSLRQAVWADLDPGRTAAPIGADPVAAWTTYALDAGVLAISADDDEDWIVDPGFTFGEWMAGAGPRRPRRDDLEFHLSTLFPPVRPRGWLELRYIDAQRGDDWVVPLAVVAALIDDRHAAVLARAALTGTEHAWERAARDGLRDPELAATARSVVEIALESMRAGGADAELIAYVERWAHTYTFAGRAPADDSAVAEARVSA